MNKFAEMYGGDFVEKEARKEFVAEVLDIVREHHLKHPKRRMTLKELDEMTGL